MITGAKGMANGVPVGLTVTTPEIAGGFQGANIATFGGNPVTSVAAKATNERMLGLQIFPRQAGRIASQAFAHWRCARHGTDAGARTGQRPQDQRASSRSRHP